MKNYYYAIDVGGTFVKGAVVSNDNNIVDELSIPTKISTEKNYLTNQISNLIFSLEKRTNLLANNSLGIGISLPGIIDADKGIVLISNNLKLFNFNIVNSLKEKFSVPIKISNDATVAALAEHILGSAKNLKNFLVLTIGTGIGGDFFVNGVPYSKYNKFSGEFGHIKFSFNNHIKCSCGEYDCFEKYASTSALVNQTRLAMLNNKNSKMWQTYDENSVNGKTVFEYQEKDATAKNVFNKYIEYLGFGIVSLVNIFNPEVVVIGGAISGQGTTLTKPLQDYVDSHKFTRNIEGNETKIVCAKLGAKAGVLGAKLLFDKEEL